jgi:hypothetical protein
MMRARGQLGPAHFCQPELAHMGRVRGALAVAGR